ncbi:MAG TPA: zinc ribbon domain-containing protein [Gemmatimonadaceae bacterium]|nr:zinc ribbon domain-containing protein [Gemmatimonadaceae bacterium]
MSAAVAALVLGTLLAVGALAFVLYPLFFGTPATMLPSEPVRQAAGGKELAVAALREIEFDRATGKLSEADYGQLKDRYTHEAIAAMRREQPTTPVGGATDVEIEAAVLAYRAQHPVCASCGPRPEQDAVFCSSCGKFLRSACERCGAHVAEPGARFCSACGHRLAA